MTGLNRHDGTFAKMESHHTCVVWRGAGELGAIGVRSLSQVGMRFAVPEFGNGQTVIRGFTVPIASWIRNELRPLVVETLEEGKLKRQGLFNSAYVHQLLREHSAGRADHRKALWTLLCFQLWYDRWGTGD